MALVTLTNTARASADLEATVTWRVSAGRELGSASVTLPRVSTLRSAAFLREAGGSLLEVGDSRLGVWRGVTMPLGDRAADGSHTIDARELGYAASQRVVSRARTFEYATAGTIVKAGFTDALAGVGALGLTPGTFTEAAPAIPRYEFRGQTFAEVLGAMQDATGQEWALAVSGAFSWSGPRGSLYTAHLTADGDLCDVQRRGSLDDRVTEVIATGRDERSYPATAHDADSLWHRQESISVDTSSPARLKMEAEQTLTRLRQPPVTYSARLKAAHWAIREGDYLALVLPEIGVGGEGANVRVLSRTWDSRSGYVTIDCALLYPFTAETPLSVGSARAEPATAVRDRRGPVRSLIELRYGAGAAAHAWQGASGR